MNNNNAFQCPGCFANNSSESVECAYCGITLRATNNPQEKEEKILTSKEMALSNFKKLASLHNLSKEKRDLILNNFKDRINEEGYVVLTKSEYRRLSSNLRKQLISQVSDFILVQSSKDNIRPIKQQSKISSRTRKKLIIFGVAFGVWLIAIIIMFSSFSRIML